MIKKLMTGLLLTASTIAFSQVGIGTVTPHASADLELGSNNKALYLNRVANTAAVANPQPGMIIYDLESKCVKAYQSNPAAWSDCLIGGDGGVLEGSITSLNCAAAVFAPASATQGQAYTGTMKISYTGGNGGVYPAHSVTINGLTFSLPLGVFATGNGELTYDITGTPIAAGTTLVSITAGGQSCSGANAIALTVNPEPDNPTGVLPGSVTLAQNSRYFIASVYDNDYMPYTAPTGPATTAVVSAGGGTETLVDILGTINTTGITVYIPATVTGTGGNVAAWSYTVTVPAHLTENGVATQVQLSWAAQTLTTANTSLVATIKAVGGTLEAKKLDINAGIGNDYLGLLLGTFQYPYNSTGSLSNYELRDIPGIPDRMFGQIDNGGEYQHNFLYLPVTAEDGKVWLNNNLGANYANVNHSAFNLTQQAKPRMLPRGYGSPELDEVPGYYDADAMGSLFQWGRRGDGHELVERLQPVYQVYPYTSPANFKYGVYDYDTNFPNPNSTWVPNVPQRIFEEPFNWVVPAEHGTNGAIGRGMWAASSPNNPCPQGFKVPLGTEWTTLKSNVSNLYATNTALKLTYGGEGTPGQYGIFNRTSPNYWTSTYGSPTYTDHRAYQISLSGVTTNGNPQQYMGKSVRCIQE